MKLLVREVPVNNCIYCRSELPSVVPAEHVIPQGFGTFKPDLTLNCVCSDCNGYFGSKLEWPMRNESIEGMLRLHFGLEGTVGGVRTRGVTPVIGEGEYWKGARTTVRTDKNGKERTDVLPQVGARRGPSDPFEWCLEQDLSVAFAERFPKGSEFRIVGGETPADLERLVQKLKEMCPTFVYGGEMNAPFAGDGRVMLHVEHQNSRTVVRCLCKIAFNYMALTCGQQFSLSQSFDELRSFIRNDSGEDESRAFVKHKPILAHEIVYGDRRTDGHILAIDCRPSDRVVEVQIALFNSFPYRIPMCTDYPGHRFMKAHHFDTQTWEVSEMRVAIAGPNFDPASLG